MTPFFTLLAYFKLNDPLFYFSQVLNDPPLFIISFYPIAPLFLQSHITQWPTFFHCGICILVNDRLVLNDPLFTTGYQMTPSLAGLVGAGVQVMTLLLLHLVRNGLVFTRVVYWMTPYFEEYTFYLIGPYFWLGVGTYLSLQIGSAPPGTQLWFLFSSDMYAHRLTLLFYRRQTTTLERAIPIWAI